VFFYGSSGLVAAGYELISALCPKQRPLQVFLRNITFQFTLGIGPFEGWDGRILCFDVGIVADGRSRLGIASDGRVLFIRMTFLQTKGKVQEHAPQT